MRGRKRHPVPICSLFGHDELKHEILVHELHVSVPALATDHEVEILKHGFKIDIVIELGRNRNQEVNVTRPDTRPVTDIGEEILVGEQAPRSDQNDVLQHALAIQSPEHFAAQFKLLASHAAPSAETESAC
jgi:hypothetical protein